MLDRKVEIRFLEKMRPKVVKTRIEGVLMYSLNGVKRLIFLGFSGNVLRASFLSTFVGTFLAFCVVSSGSFAQATINGSKIDIPVVTIGAQGFQVELSIVDGTSPVELLVTNGTELTDFSSEGASTFDGTTLAIPSLDVDGTAYWANFAVLSEEPPTFVLVDVGVVAAEPPQSCVRPEPDPSHGPDDPTLIAGFTVNPNFIQDGGPGQDGIPAIDTPVFTQDFNSQSITDSTLVIGVKIGDDVRAYSHTVMDYHEIVNDIYTIDGVAEPVSINYCPLTGSAMLWKGDMASADPTFGTSGQLFNSNLVMYDRETNSWWSQMLEQAINSVQRLAIPDRLQVVETNWSTWRSMYPQTTLLTKDTGFSRPYGLYPYGSFKTDNSILFNVSDDSDGRLQRKTRVLGINVGEASKVYPISNFDAAVTVLNDTVGVMDVVATGSSELNFGSIFNRQLEDCTTLSFSAVQDQLPIVMVDNEGSEWDVFGVAVSGPRAGTQLQKTNSYIAYWFAWATFFTGAEIYQ
jgi:hypothetical protein